MASKSEQARGPPKSTRPMFQRRSSLAIFPAPFLPSSSSNRSPPHSPSMSSVRGHTAHPPSWTSLFPGGSPTTPLPQYSAVPVGMNVEKYAIAPTPARSWMRHGPKVTIVACVVMTSVVTALLWLAFQRPEDRRVLPEPVLRGLGSDSRKYLRGPPTQTYAENLVPDVQYITSWLSAGWTNDVMTYANLIYLALLTERVPIIGPFVPSHLPREAGFVSFGEVFDVERLSKGVNLPILEWKDVKDVNSTSVEPMGCWSSWMGSVLDDERPRGTMIPTIVNVDVSYTPMSHDIKVYGAGDPHIYLQRLMQVGFPSGRAVALSQSSPLPSQIRGDIIEPSDHLLCFDFLYYASVDRAYEWEYDWSPQWRFVGQYMRWAPPLQDLANQYLNQAFGTPLNGPVPHYIGVHARRGDFHFDCGPDDWSCLPTVRQLQRRVQEVQVGLAARGIATDRVVVTSDEMDPVWWDEVRAAGFIMIDHIAARTEEKYGKWYAPLLDAVFQSSGVGFVGTDGSTMSLVAERRVQSWQNGIVSRLRWRGLADPNDL